jgi:hypothetical protein
MRTAWLGERLLLWSNTCSIFRISATSGCTMVMTSGSWRQGTQLEIYRMVQVLMPAALLT